MEELIELVTGEQATRVFEEYWPHIAAGLLLLAKLIRRRTLHWALWPKATRIFGLVIEILDVIHLPKITPSHADLEKAEERARQERDQKRAAEIKKRVVEVKRKSGEYPRAGGPQK